jgi:hypothetical protein
MAIPTTIDLTGRRKRYIGKIDFNHQADEHHLIKAGFEYKSYDLFYKNVNLYQDAMKTYFPLTRKRITLPL